MRFKANAFIPVRENEIDESPVYVNPANCELIVVDNELWQYWGNGGGGVSINESQWENNTLAKKIEIRLKTGEEISGWVVVDELNDCLCNRRNAK